MGRPKGKKDSVKRKNANYFGNQNAKSNGRVRNTLGYHKRYAKKKSRVVSLITLKDSDIRIEQLWKELDCIRRNKTLTGKVPRSRVVIQSCPKYFYVHPKKLKRWAYYHWKKSYQKLILKLCNVKIEDVEINQIVYEKRANPLLNSSYWAIVNRCLRDMYSSEQRRKLSDKTFKSEFEIIKELTDLGVFVPKSI
ncbi:MAG: hypothetical protein ABIG64_09025 [Candidatus Omnitrophota bacterium]